MELVISELTMELVIWEPTMELVIWEPTMELVISVVTMASVISAPIMELFIMEIIMDMVDLAMVSQHHTQYTVDTITKILHFIKDFFAFFFALPHFLHLFVLHLFISSLSAFYAFIFIVCGLI